MYKRMSIEISMVCIIDAAVRSFHKQKAKNFKTNTLG